MMKIIAFYREPKDWDSFLRHYHEVHAPLVRKIPGLISFEVIRIQRSLLGELPYAMMAEMSYPDAATFKAAMRSPEQAAVAADLETFATGLITAVQGETIG